MCANANFAFAHIRLKFTKPAVLQCTIHVPLLKQKTQKDFSIDGIACLCFGGSLPDYTAKNA